MRSNRKSAVGACRGRPCAAICAAAVTAFAAPALADGFSPTEGFNASGGRVWKFEVGPIGWLPRTDINAQLGSLPAQDVSIPIGDIVSNLTGGFMGDAYARYGNVSGELNAFWVSLGKNQTYPLPGDRTDGVNVRLHAAVLSLSPGVGYRVIASRSDKVALDMRAGFTYSWSNATAHIQDSPGPGIGKSSSFVQPWIGARLSYFPSSRWRIMNTAALTGLGVDGGKMGWNAAIGVSYLAKSWLDVTLGYRAAQSFSTKASDQGGPDLATSILDYGPVVGAGFRF